VFLLIWMLLHLQDPSVPELIRDFCRCWLPGIKLFWCFIMCLVVVWMFWI
jgi:hypothetical protein